MSGDWDAVDRIPFVVSGCRLGKVYSYQSERNAYHSTYYVDGPCAIFFDLDEVHSAVEEKRARGTHFRIFEHPAVVLRVGPHEVTMSDTDHSHPFSNAHIGPLGGRRLGDLSRAIIPTLKYGHPYLSMAKHTVLANLPFQIHDSRSRGGDLPLAWSRSRAQIELQGVLSVLTAITLHLQSGEL